MITRGIITKNESESEGGLRVYIPILDGKQDDSFVGTKVASVLAIPGIQYDYNVGDVVLIGFENNEMSSPIILGFLKSSLSEDKRSSIKAYNIDIDNNINLSTKVSFGDTGLGFNDIFNAINNN